MNEKFLIYDNYLDVNDFLRLKNNLLSVEFPWFYNPFIDHAPRQEGYTDHQDNFQFVHYFYEAYAATNNNINLLKPLIEKINPSTLIRIKANLLTRTECIRTNNFHTDFPFKKSKTAIFYVNSNNGKTLFKSGDEVDSIENRLVVFDCGLEHTGTSCTDEKVRCVINFNYYEQEK
jgi:hypothetical protein